MKQNGTTFTVPDFPFLSLDTQTMTSHGYVVSFDQSWPQSITTHQWDHHPTTLYVGAIANDPLTGAVFYNGENITYTTSTPGWSESILNWTPNSPQWFVVHTHQIVGNYFSSGITDGIGVVINHNGSGDTTALEGDVQGKNFRGAGSDEGNDNVRATNQEGHATVGLRVTGGGVGAQILSTTCGGNFCSDLSVGFPLIDTTTDVLTNTITKTGLTASKASIVTLAVAVPISACGTLAADFSNVHRGQVNQSYTNTVSVSTTSDLSINPNTGAAWTSNPLAAIGGGTLIERFGGVSSHITFGAYNSGTHLQPVTANFVYSYPVNSTVCFGGLAGRFAEQTNYTTTPVNSPLTRYPVTVLGTPTATTALLAASTSADLGGSFIFGTQPVKIYHGGHTNQIHGALNPTTNVWTPDVTTLYVEPNDAAWAIGDAVEQQFQPSAAYHNMGTLLSAYNPFAEVKGWVGGFNSNQLSSPFMLDWTDNVPLGTLATGGTAGAPGIVNHSGPWGVLINADRAPETWTKNGNTYPGSIFQVPSYNGDPPYYIHHQAGAYYGLRYHPPSADGTVGGTYEIYGIDNQPHTVCVVGACGILTMHFTTTAATSDTFTPPGFPITGGGSIVGVAPTNAAAVASSNYGVTSKNFGGSITFAHAATAGMTFDITYTTY